MQNPKLKTDSKPQPFKWFIIFYATKNETIINIPKRAKRNIPNYDLDQL